MVSPAGEKADWRERLDQTRGRVCLSIGVIQGRLWAQTRLCIDWFWACVEELSCRGLVEEPLARLSSNGCGHVGEFKAIGPSDNLTWTSLLLDQAEVVIH